jgi:hypothetical protein
MLFYADVLPKWLFMEDENHMARPATTPKKKCIGDCGKEKTLINFYASESRMFVDKKVPLCKECIKKEINDEDLNTVKKILSQIDKPFIESEWFKAKSSDKESFGWYLRQISSLPQYKGMGYKDSIQSKSTALHTKDYERIEEDDYDEDFEEEDNISSEIILSDTYDLGALKRKWGSGYTPSEYRKLQEYWDDMTTTNNISTPQHKRSLELYCVLNILVDRALKDQDWKTFETLNKQLAVTLKDAGFRPIDKVSGNESAGIRSFSQIFEEVEKSGFIVPAPLEFHQDIIDRTIMYLVNYQRKLLNMGTLDRPPDDTPDFEGDEW